MSIFSGRKPLAGHEHLGAAVTDKHGHPSGSPANYAATAGKGETIEASPVTADEIAAAVEGLTVPTKAGE